MKPEKQLYQWDVNQYLTELQPTAQFVDYPIGNEVIRLDTNGTRCRIPDEILQTYGGKTCYERYPDGTYRAYSFTVLYSPKPPDYVFTPEERTTFEALTARVDAAIAEIKRRADSGEFTPKKGVDYFTDAEKNEMMENVSSGAVGEFRKVVDSATTEYNDNHNLKLAEYNANASEKLTTYDTNAEQHTTDYNANAAEKLEAYNQNHTEKVAEYNQNAETKTAEFNSNAAALQTEVDRLRGECDTLAAENRKQENRISALMKLNKGQTYDILPEEGETASRTAPSGAKYVSVDKVGGKSVVWNQTPEYNIGTIISSQIDAIEVRGKNLCPICTSPSKVQNGVNWHNNGDGTITATGVATDYTVYEILQPMTPIPNIIKGKIITISAGLAPTSNVVLSGFTLYDKSNKMVALTLSGLRGGSVDMSLYPNAEYMTFGVKRNNNIKVDALITPMIEIGSTATPYKSYSLQTIPTNLPVLRSAGAAHDAIDMDGGTIQRNIGAVDLGTLDWTYNSEYKFMLANVDGKLAGTINIIISRYNLSPNEVWQQDTDGVYGGNENNNIIYIKDLNYSDPVAFKEAIRGVMLHYELATPTTEPLTIPEALQEWLPVEAGGTVTFRNSDDTKQLPVPNAVSWVRKLDEVN